MLRPAPAAPAGAHVPGYDDAVLEVEDLRVTLPGAKAPVQAVRGVTFTVKAGEIVGIVGESGSGKTMTALAVAQLVPDPGRVDASTLRFLGTDLLTAPKGRLRRLLGTSLAMVFQAPIDRKR